MSAEPPGDSAPPDHIAQAPSVTTAAQLVADQLPALGLPAALAAQLHLTDTSGWPPRPGRCISPDFPDMPRIWARISLAEWLNTAPDAFGLHRSPELTALAAADRWLRRAGEGTHILWALDIVAAHYWVDNARTALAVTELVCVGPELDTRLLARLDQALDAAGWRPTPGAEPNSACIINHTPCHYSAWNDAISTLQYQGDAQQGQLR